MGELGWEQQGVWEQVNRQGSGNRGQDIRWERIRGAGVEVSREQSVNIRGREWRITITGGVGRADCIITGWRHNKFGLSCTFGQQTPQQPYCVRFYAYILFDCLKGGCSLLGVGPLLVLSVDPKKDKKKETPFTAHMSCFGGGRMRRSSFPVIRPPRCFK